MKDSADAMDKLLHVFGEGDSNEIHNNSSIISSYIIVLFFETQIIKIKLSKWYLFESTCVKWNE